MIDFQPGRTGSTDVLFCVQANVGLILLNRPRTINAISSAMIRALRTELTAWSVDDRIQRVVLRGSGDRGLCSGGDVLELRDAIIRAGGIDANVHAFWEAEYRLNAQIAHFSKPFLSIMDGVVMGGGIGISTFATLRLVTERTKVAMPETIIGFFPDVGASFPLSRATGELGTHMVMTGATVAGSDAIALGLADVMISSNDLDDLVADLVSGERVRLPRTPSQASPLLQSSPWIDACYTGNDPQAIVERLASHHDADARAAATMITRRSPLSVAVALAAIRRARSMESVDQVFAQDLLLSRRFAPDSDLVEGVRAQLVDRDHRPRWQHRSLAEVPRSQVQSYFNVPV